MQRNLFKHKSFSAFYSKIFFFRFYVPSTEEPILCIMWLLKQVAESFLPGILFGILNKWKKLNMFLLYQHA